MMHTWFVRLREEAECRSLEFGAFRAKQLCLCSLNLYVRSEVCASGIGGVPVPPLALEPQSPIFARSRTRAVVPREQNATCRPSTLKRKICYDKKILPERRYPRQQLQSYSNVPEFDCNQIQTARQVDLFV